VWKFAFFSEEGEMPLGIGEEHSSTPLKNALELLPYIAYQQGIVIAYYIEYGDTLYT
jgi:hypothetical protein